jgi:hypothetical protein
MYPKKETFASKKNVSLTQVWFVLLQRKISQVLTIPHSSAMHQLTSLLDGVTTHDFLRKMCFSDEIFHVSGAVNRHSCRTRGNENLYDICDMETVTN